MKTLFIFFGEYNMDTTKCLFLAPFLESIEIRYYELRNYINIVKATIVDNMTLNIAIKQHFDILVLIQTIVGDKISYDKKFKHYIHNKLKIGVNVDPF